MVSKGLLIAYAGAVSSVPDIRRVWSDSSRRQLWHSTSCSHSIWTERMHWSYYWETTQPKNKIEQLKEPLYMQSQKHFQFYYTKHGSSINIWWLGGTLWNSFLQWRTTFWLAASQIWCSLFEYELLSVGVHHVRLLFWYLGYKVKLREGLYLLMEGIHCTVSVWVCWGEVVVFPFLYVYSPCLLFCYMYTFMYLCVFFPSRGELTPWSWELSLFSAALSLSPSPLSLVSPPLPLSSLAASLSLATHSPTTSDLICSVPCVYINIQWNDQGHLWDIESVFYSEVFLFDTCTYRTVLAEPLKRCPLFGGTV